MTTSATQPGVVNDRNEMMAEIARNREAQIDAEMRESGDEGLSVLARHEDSKVLTMPEGTDQAEWDGLDEVAKAALVDADKIRREAEAAIQNDPQAAERKATLDRIAAEEAGTQPRKIKIKVDGQEQDVEWEKVKQAGIAALQKESAADKRLEEASRLFKEAQATMAAAQRGPVPDPNQGSANLPAGDSAVQQLTDEAFIEAVKKIQYGSQEEASAALKELVTKAAVSGKPEALTMAEVTEFLDFREATSWAHDEYREILGDPKLKTLFSSEEKRLRAAGDMRPYRELYTDIGNGLREWLKTASPSQSSPQPNARETRHERKAAVVQIPAAAARQSPAKPQQKEPTPSEVVDQMRKARRQA